MKGHEALYKSQLNREDMKGIKTVVKWTYVDHKIVLPGQQDELRKFLIVTCRWSAKLWKRLSKSSVYHEKIIISPMFSAGKNREFKWEMKLAIKSKDFLNYDISTFETNGVGVDFTISLLKEDLTLEELFNDGLESDKSFDGASQEKWPVESLNIAEDYLRNGGTTISFITGFVVDSTDLHKLTNSVEALPANGNILEKLWENPQFSDVTFIVEQKALHAHRNVLAIISPVFSKLFNEKVPSHCTVEIQEFKYCTIKEMLQFIYTGKFTDHSQEKLKLLLMVSKKYDIRSLFLQSQKVLLKYLNVDNALEFMQLGRDLDAKEIIIASINLITESISEDSSDDIEKNATIQDN